LKKTVRPLCAWIGVLIAAGGVFLFSGDVTVLSVRNLGRPATSFCFKTASSEQLTLFYINSMYSEPVEEVFEVTDGDIILKAVRTSSPAVMEYYGFDNPRSVQHLHRNLGRAFVIQVSVNQEQRVTIGDRTIHLRDLGNPGERVQVRVNRVSPASFILSGMMHRREPREAPVKNP